MDGADDNGLRPGEAVAARAIASTATTGLKSRPTDAMSPT